MILLVIVIMVVVFLIRRRKKRVRRMTQPVGDSKLYVTVSTCKKYKDKTIPTLLENLKSAGVPDDRILIVSGGEDTDDDSGPIKKTRYQFWELTSLIWLASQEDKGDYYFMMHDTSRIEPHFWESLQEKFREMDTDGMSLLENNGGLDMNMGIYKHSYLISRKEELDDLKRYHKDGDELGLFLSKVHGVIIEGKFLEGFPLMYEKDQVNITFDEHKCINTVPELGFTKIQQNCGRFQT